MYLPPKFKGSPAIPSTNACSSVVFLLLFCRIAKAKALKKEVGLVRPFFRVELDFGPKIWVESGRVGPQGQNSGQIRVGLVGFIWSYLSLKCLRGP